MVLVVVLLWLAMGLRFHNLGAQSFWNDEGNSARLSERTIQLIIEGTASDIHPPLYYLLLRGWRELAGDSEFGLRSLSAFAGLLVVPLAMALARNPQSAIRNPQWLLVGLITAVSPPLIYYSQEARMYALLGLLAALSTWLLVRSAESGVRNWGYAVAYVLTAVAGLYTHYFFPAVLAAQGAVVVIWAVRDWRLSHSALRTPHSPLRIPHSPPLGRHDVRHSAPLPPLAAYFSGECGRRGGTAVRPPIFHRGLFLVGVWSDACANGRSLVVGGPGRAAGFGTGLQLALGNGRGPHPPAGSHPVHGCRRFDGAAIF
ncbi:MAG: glycosyltransferase family 39 protein [Chloroflexi bacterium]|nr:glycosyltransferase family 39 protein [Chloroflexota bacterium]